MRIGFVGLGKLGLPCAAAMSTKLGTTIYGHDRDHRISSYISTNTVPYLEAEIESYLKSANLKFTESVYEVVDNSDIVFVAVQTPHDPQYEGVTPMPNSKKDFEYIYLENSIREIKDAFLTSGKESLDVVVISTVLPGTVNSRLLPIVKGSGINLLYNPYFIAMGTTIYDFLYPEFVIIGHDDIKAVDRLKALYEQFLACPVIPLSYTEAELVKVSYNTFIGMKIVFANTLAEITQKLGGNVDSVTGALAMANNRLISPKYLLAGMGDGGGCHPRDQIAMSWLASNLGLSFDIFETLSLARDAQTKRHAEILKQQQEHSGLPIIILGEAYKKNINLTVGSPSKLLQHYLRELNATFTVFDPVVHPTQQSDFSPSIFYVATPHDIFKDLSIPIYSVVYDPWGKTIPQQYGVRFEYLGRGVWG